MVAETAQRGAKPGRSLTRRDGIRRRMFTLDDAVFWRVDAFAAAIGWSTSLTADVILDWFVDAYADDPGIKEQLERYEAIMEIRRQRGGETHGHDDARGR